MCSTWWRACSSGRSFGFSTSRFRDLRAEEKEKVKPASGEVEQGIRKGEPFSEVVQAARKEEIDLIVMGTHGKTGLSHALMGSTAERVVRLAPCPVLAIRSPEYESVMP